MATNIEVENKEFDEVKEINIEDTEFKDEDGKGDDE